VARGLEVPSAEARERGLVVGGEGRLGEEPELRVEDDARGASATALSVARSRPPCARGGVPDATRRLTSARVSPLVLPRATGWPSTAASSAKRRGIPPAAAILTAKSALPWGVTT
jgi:hypothetical protein